VGYNKKFRASRTGAHSASGGRGREKFNCLGNSSPELQTKIRETKREKEERKKGRKEGRKKREGERERERGRRKKRRRRRKRRRMKRRKRKRKRRRRRRRRETDKNSRYLLSWVLGQDSGLKHTIAMYQSSILAPSLQN